MNSEKRPNNRMNDKNKFIMNLFALLNGIR